MKSMRVYLVLMLLVAVVISGCSAAAQGSEEGAQAPAARTVKVVGRGDAYSAPDEARVQIGVETFSVDIQEAVSTNETQIQQIMNVLEEKGIASADIQTSNYSLWTEQRYDNGNPMGVAGYRVANQVNVRIRDIEQVDDLLAAVVEAGATSIYGLQLTVSDPSTLESEAREKAMADATERANSVAGLAGVMLGEVLAVNEMFNQYAVPMGGLGGGDGSFSAAGASFAPGELGYQVQLEVTYAIQ